MNRRQFLGYALAGAGAGIGGLALWNPLRGTRHASARSAASPDFRPDVEIALTARPAEVQIFPGRPTRVQRYFAEVLRGDPSTVHEIEGSYLGPIFRLRRGQKVRIRFTSELSQPTIVHWHGLHVPSEMDGHPQYVIGKDETYVYEFEVKNRAGTYWFHPHPHKITGPQVYAGLAGLFLVTDEEERSLDLPDGEYDVPIVIQDRSFDGDNQLVYLRNRMERVFGFLGEQILVNGQPEAELGVAARAYRFRVLNGSNSRIYKLAWDDGTPLTVIGTDGGLLPAPVQKRYLILGPAERVDLWADFSGRPVGSVLTLKSLPFSGAEAPRMGGMMGMGRRGGRGRSVPPNGAELTLFRVRVERQERETRALPERLASVAQPDPSEAVNYARPRTFRFGMRRMQPVINGRTFEMTGVAADEIVRLNTTEVWEMVNGGGGMMGGMMQMPHPVHIHGLQFRIIDRSPSTGWDTIRDGFVDSGWKDTFLLMPGMRVKVLLRFEDYAGLFLYHCHNLEHEDLGMMRNYLVKAG